MLVGNVVGGVVCILCKATYKSKYVTNVKPITFYRVNIGATDLYIWPNWSLLFRPRIRIWWQSQNLITLESGLKHFSEIRAQTFELMGTAERLSVHNDIVRERREYKGQAFLAWPVNKENVTLRHRRPPNLPEYYISSQYMCRLTHVFFNILINKILD